MNTEKQSVKKVWMIVLLSVLIISIIVIICKIAIPKQHEYYCDKFLFRADSKEIDLKERYPDIQSVVELLPITEKQLSVICRLDETSNLLLIYDFNRKDFVFEEKGTGFAWIQDDYKSTVYLKEDKVFDLEGNIVFQAEQDKHISVIEYVGSDFMVTVTDLQYENPNQIYVEY